MLVGVERICGDAMNGDDRMVNHVDEKRVRMLMDNNLIDDASSPCVT